MVKDPVIMSACTWCREEVEMTIAKGLCPECYHLYGTDLEEGDKAKIREKWLKYKVNDIRGRQKRRRVLKVILEQTEIPHDIFSNILCYVGLEGMIGDGDVNPLVDKVEDKLVDEEDIKKIE